MDGEIVNFYGKISDIYFKMIQLELDGKIDSDEFRELVGLLKEDILKERKLLNSLTDNECEVLRDYLGNEVEALSMRVYNYIELYRNSDSLLSIEDIKEEKIYNACAKNIFLMYLSFLQEKISTASEYREEIITFKYLNAFANPDIEMNLVDNNFLVKETIDVDIYAVVDMIGLDFKVAKEVIKTCYLDTAREMVIQIMEISDKEHLSGEGIALATYSECMIRACLSLINTNEYEEIKNMIDLSVKLLSNEHNRMSADLIASAMKGRDKDKSRVRMISLRPIID